MHALEPFHDIEVKIEVEIMVEIEIEIEIETEVEIESMWSMRDWPDSITVVGRGSTA